MLAYVMTASHDVYDRSSCSAPSSFSVLKKICSLTIEGVSLCRHECTLDVDKTPKTEASLPSMQKDIRSSASFVSAVFQNKNVLLPNYKVVCTILDGKW